MAAILSLLRLVRHRSIHSHRVRIIVITANLRRVDLLTRCCGCRRWCCDGEVGEPGKLDFADGGNDPGTEHEFFGLVAFFEGYDKGVGLVGVGFDGFVFAKAL